jgi:F0F1-type ATP synthase assembly protein I
MVGYAQLAMLLPAATVVGWLIGVALDRWLHTTWLYILGLILGIVAGFVELIRTVVKDSKNA